MKRIFPLVLLILSLSYSFAQNRTTGEIKVKVCPIFSYDKSVSDIEKYFDSIGWEKTDIKDNSFSYIKNDSEQNLFLSNMFVDKISFVYDRFSRITSSCYEIDCKEENVSAVLLNLAVHYKLTFDSHEYNNEAIKYYARSWQYFVVLSSIKTDSLCKPAITFTVPDQSQLDLFPELKRVYNKINKNTFN